MQPSADLMRRTLFIAATLIALSTSLKAQEASEARNWLTTSIEKYFADYSPKRLTEITTEQYARYKQDAICVVYDCDGSLTMEQFEQKWGNIYDVTYAGFYSSFLIDQQDWYKIVVTKCELLEQPSQGKYIFNTEVTDTGFELSHMNEITVVQTGNGYKIDDVKLQK